MVGKGNLEEAVQEEREAADLKKGDTKVIRNEKNRQSYSEAFDMERLEEIADLAKKGIYLNGSYSDFECHVHSLMMGLIEYGKDAVGYNGLDVLTLSDKRLIQITGAGTDGGS